MNNRSSSKAVEHVQLSFGMKRNQVGLPEKTINSKQTASDIEPRITRRMSKLK